MEKRKVLITAGMSHDAMLFVTDAPKREIENFCRKTNKDIEDGVGNGYDYIRDKDYYIKELLNSETDSPDDLNIIGFDEVYDLTNYQDSIMDKKEYKQLVDAADYICLRCSELSEENCAKCPVRKTMKKIENNKYIISKEDTDNIAIEITLERTQRISKQIKATKDQLLLLEGGENPFQEEMEKVLDDGEFEYDYTVCDLEGNTLVDWQ